MHFLSLKTTDSQQGQSYLMGCKAELTTVKQAGFRCPDVTIAFGEMAKM